MPPILIDLIMAVLILGITYALSSEGLWGSALMFFNVLFAGIIAFNFYEPLAGLLAANVNFISGFADTLILMTLFIVALVMLRLTTETIAPSMVRFPPVVYNIGRLFFGLAGALVTMAFLLVVFETAPVNKKVFGVVDYSYRPPFKLGLDHEWLGFFQYTTGLIFADYNSGKHDPFSEYGTAKVFDPRSEWLLQHQDARPYGTDKVLVEEAAAAPAAGAAPAPAAGAAPAGGMPGAAPGMPGAAPGMPGAPGMPPGPGMPPTAPPGVPK